LHLLRQPVDQAWESGLHGLRQLVSFGHVCWFDAVDDQFSWVPIKRATECDGRLESGAVGAGVEESRRQWLCTHFEPVNGAGRIAPPYGIEDDCHSMSFPCIDEAGGFSVEEYYFDGW
jgi:hypothetical protein